MEHLADSIALVSAIAASTLLNAVLEGSVLAVLVSLGLRLLPDIRPASRFMIWTSVLFAALALHFAPLQNQLHGSASLKDITIRLNARWSVALVSVWGLISLSRLIRLLYSAICIRRLTANAIPVVPEPVCEMLLCANRRPVSMYISTNLDRPSVVGFFQPRIVIPQDVFAKLSSQELEQILIHEMEHIRRGDNWTNLFQKLALALFPLNPALCWIDRHLCTERELACDDCVLDATSCHKVYALCLTNLAEYSLLRRNLSLTLGAWSKKSELGHRVHRILYRSEKSLSRNTGFAVTAMFVAALLGCSISLARVPSIVSFSSYDAIKTSNESAVVADSAVAQTVDHRGQLAPTLVKAIMHEPQVAAPTRHVHQHHAGADIPKSRLRHSISTPNVFVRTSLESQTRLPGLILTVYETTEPTYAAVPIGNGWLVIQL